MSATSEELSAIKDIGEITAEGIRRREQDGEEKGTEQSNLEIKRAYKKFITEIFTCVFFKTCYLTRSSLFVTGSLKIKNYNKIINEVLYR